MDLCLWSAMKRLSACTAASHQPRPSTPICLTDRGEGRGVDKSGSEPAPVILEYWTRANRLSRKVEKMTSNTIGRTFMGHLPTKGDWSKQWQQRSIRCQNQHKQVPRCAAIEDHLPWDALKKLRMRMEAERTMDQNEAHFSSRRKYLRNSAGNS